MERRKFTREFKLEAVRLIKDRGVSYMQAAQDFGCPSDAAAQLGEGVGG
jgi:transposase-like protein